MTLDWELGAIVSALPMLASMGLATFFWTLLRRGSDGEHVDCI